MNSLAPLHHPDGVIFDDFIDRSFGWDREVNLASGRLPYTKPWIGVFHNPPTLPDWYDYQKSPQSILNDPVMQDSLKYCKGLFTLSVYLRDWLSTRISVPVSCLTHTTQTTAEPFTFDRFEANQNKKIIQIGVWLRRFEPFTRLNAGDLQKIWLLTTEKARFHFDAECRRLGIDPQEPRYTDVKRLGWVPHREYDSLLSENLIFCNLTDASANNLIVECIVRDTPLLVNPLPAVEEYLGEDYPLYFRNIEEAEAKLADHGAIRDACQYLQQKDKTPFLGNAMERRLRESKIYRSLPVPESRGERTDSPESRSGSAMQASVDQMMREVRNHIDSHNLRDPVGPSPNLQNENRMYKLIVAGILRENISRWD